MSQQLEDLKTNVAALKETSNKVLAKIDALEAGAPNNDAELEAANAVITSVNASLNAKIGE